MKDVFTEDAPYVSLFGEIDAKVIKAFSLTEKKEYLILMESKLESLMKSYYEGKLSDRSYIDAVFSTLDEFSKYTRQSVIDSG
jgi:hypothetical protein